jgi:tetratricopeptide (TPR) repeat protein
MTEAPSGEERANALRLALIEYGIDLSRPDAARTINQSSLREPIIHALHDWVRSPLFGINDGLKAQTQDVRALIESIDQDPWRKRFRSACFDRDLAMLVSLAKDDRVSALPPSAALLLADSLIEHGLHDDADQVLRSSRRMHEGDFMLNQRLCWLSTERRSYEDAVAFGRSAESIRPGKGGGFPLAIALLKSNRVEEAHALADRMSSFSEGLLTKMTRALIAQSLGNRNQVIQLAREICELSANDASVQIAGATAFLSAGMKVDAAEAFDRAARSTKDVHRRALAGGGLVDCGRFKDGIEILESVITIAPNSPVASEFLSIALFKSAQWSRCVVAGERAIELNPRSFDLRMHRGLALAQLARLDEACTVLQSLVESVTSEGRRKEATKALDAARSAQEVLNQIREVIAGNHAPESRDEWSQLIGYVKAFKIHLTEARLWKSLWSTAPQIYDSLSMNVRSHAISAGLSAAAGLGVEEITIEGRVEGREFARALCEAEILKLEALEDRADAISQASSLTKGLGSCTAWPPSSEVQALPPQPKSGSVSWSSLLDRLTRLSQP